MFRENYFGCLSTLLSSQSTHADTFISLFRSRNIGMVKYDLHDRLAIAHGKHLRLPHPICVFSKPADKQMLTFCRTNSHLRLSCLSRFHPFRSTTRSIQTRNINLVPSSSLAQSHRELLRRVDLRTGNGSRVEFRAGKQFRRT